MFIVLRIFIFALSSLLPLFLIDRYRVTAFHSEQLRLIQLTRKPKGVVEWFNAWFPNPKNWYLNTWVYAF